MYSMLFDNYNAKLKPYCGNNDPIQLRLDMALRQIIDLDEPAQIIKLNIWLRMKWYDCRLQWNPSDYGNITFFVIHSKFIWIPDLTMYHSVGDEFVGISSFLATVYSDGTVYYNFPSIVENLCSLNVEKFPYDSQSCKLVFGSWAYSGNDVSIVYKNPYGDLSMAEDNVEWTVESITARRHVLYYPCCPEPYPDVTYYINMKRKPNFYIMNLIVPSFAITAMALLGFMLPVESGEKVSLEITVMLSLAVFQLLVADKLPPSAEVTPLIATYFNFALFLVGLSCMKAVLVVNIYHQGERRMPRWVYKVFILNLSKITFTTLRTIHQKDEKMDTDSKSLVKNQVAPDKKGSTVMTLSDVDFDCQGSETNLTERIKDKADRDLNVSYTEEWKVLSNVINMLSFYLTACVLIIGTSVIFSSFHS
ncbi:hypothetical protein FSP39_023337 [Pinctada imbricata]|uniref:Uncharacterized protein n=1 Tax=Pinctada imbricata TaxID=66713 RepID=A0AA88Y6M5_PINIB|nr:hypothetical protein FSP39_023337 [Pinctada imbricata]